MNLAKIKVVLSKIGQINVKPPIKKDPCRICGRKTMTNSVLCKLYGNWIHGRHAKFECVINRRGIDFVCRKSKRRHEIVGDKKEKLHYDVETVTYIFI